MPLLETHVAWERMWWNRPHEIDKLEPVQRDWQALKYCLRFFMRQSRFQIFDWVIRCSLFRIKWQLISPTAPPNQQISQPYQNKCSSRIESGSSFYMHTHKLLHRHSEVSRGQLNTEETTEIILPWLYVSGHRVM